MSTFINVFYKYKKIIYAVLIILSIPLFTLATEIVFDSGRVIGTFIRTSVEQGVC